MNSYSLATIKIVYGALFPETEFTDACTAVKQINLFRIDSAELFAYASAISKNDVTPYYETLCKQLRNVIEERDVARSPVLYQVMGRGIRRLVK